MRRMTLVLIFSILLFPSVLAAGPGPDSVREIGSRRELFVDRFLIARLDGASLRLHEPQPAEKVLEIDRP